MTPFVKLLDVEDYTVKKVGLSAAMLPTLAQSLFYPLRQMVMDGIQNILQVGLQRNGSNIFLDALEEAQGLDRLQLLALDQNDQIASQAQLIIKRYIPSAESAVG